MIDVSNNNGHVDWAKVAASGHKIAVVKASEGSNRFADHYYDDRFFHYNMIGAKANGILPCPYYFARPGTPAVPQARHFLEISRTYVRKGSGKLLLDIEDTGERTSAELIHWVTEFCETMQSVLHTLTPLYSNTAFLENFGRRFVKHPLWVANYNYKPQLPPHAIGDWPRSMVYAHQYTDKGSCNGIEGNVDISRRFVSLGHFKLGGRFTWAL